MCEGLSERENFGKIPFFQPCHLTTLNNTMAWFPSGLDCIFRLRGTPYSRWAFHISNRSNHASELLSVGGSGLVADCPILWLFSFLLIKRFHSMSGSPVSRICADISAYATFRSVGRVQRLSGLPRNLTISHDTRLSCADQKAGVSCVAPVLFTNRATMKWGNVLPPSHKKDTNAQLLG